MALLSVIVPVHRVENYLAACLDSILGQSFTDIEVIAVDDASDDGCAAILDRYAAQDPRLTVVTRPHNGGLGAARNTGRARARADYLWFIDSDDRLPAGALAAVAERLLRIRPDLLVTGFARCDGEARIRSVCRPGVGGGAAGPATFTVRDQPGLLSSLHIACNKIISARFLNYLGLNFGPGWYEDVSFSFPLLLSADRISVLDRCCYLYHQRYDGAITSTVSDRHFEVFGQWDRVFAFLDTRPETPTEIRTLVFQRMVWHLFQVLNHPRRVPPHRRREFFRMMAESYRTHSPPGVPAIPPGAWGVKHRLVAHDAYRLFAALRTLRRAKMPLVGRQVARLLAAGRGYPGTAGRPAVPPVVPVPPVAGAVRPRDAARPEELTDRLR